MQRHILPWTIIVLVPVFGAQYAEQLVIVFIGFEYNPVMDESIAEFRLKLEYALKTEINVIKIMCFTYYTLNV